MSSFASYTLPQIKQFLEAFEDAVQQTGEATECTTERFSIGKRKCRIIWSGNRRQLLHFAEAAFEEGAHFLGLDAVAWLMPGDPLRLELGSLGEMVITKVRDEYYVGVNEAALTPPRIAQFASKYISPIPKTIPLRAEWGSPGPGVGTGCYRERPESFYDDPKTLVDAVTLEAKSWHSNNYTQLRSYNVSGLDWTGTLEETIRLIAKIVVSPRYIKNPRGFRCEYSGLLKRLYLRHRFGADMFFVGVQELRVEPYRQTGMAFYGRSLDYVLGKEEIHFPCRSCRTNIIAPSSHVGLTGKCKKCGSKNVIPWKSWEYTYDPEGDERSVLQWLTNTEGEYHYKGKTVSRPEANSICMRLGYLYPLGDLLGILRSNSPQKFEAELAIQMTLTERCRKQKDDDLLQITRIEHVANTTEGEPTDWDDLSTRSLEFETVNCSRIRHLAANELIRRGIDVYSDYRY